MHRHHYWKTNLALLWGSQLLVLAGFAAAMPFIPLFIADHLGIVETGPRGAVVASFNFAGTLGYGLFCPLWGILADRVGVKPMLYRGTFLAAFVFPLMAWTTTPWQLIAVRFLSAAMAGTTNASQILIVKNTPNDHQGYALGLLGTAYWAGTMLGNVIGGFAVVRYGYTAAFLFCGLCYILGGILVLFCREHRRKAAAATDGRAKGRPSRAAITGSVLLVLSLVAAYGFVRFFELPYVAMRVEEIVGRADAARWTAITNTAIAVGAFLSGFIIGRLADRLRPALLLVPALGITVVLLLVQSFADDIGTFAAARTLLYLIGGGLGAVMQKMLALLTPPKDRGTVFGVQSTAHSLGVMLSTAASGALIYELGARPATAAWGVRGVFLGAAALSLLFMPACLLMIRRASRGAAG
ncbi:MAG: MFS transporter [Kiritimatiellae bacterium]|nr:MFS transporter [Kiritimatiellia bacterium]